MKILHKVTYTIDDGNIRLEKNADISRKRRLTHRGCERILRKRGVRFPVVTRVETIIDER